MTFEEIMKKEDFTPNDEQRKIIESTVNTVVAAGAGTGKTEVLSWRFLRLVMEEKVAPDEILTLTFTRKAANEMRMRIYSRLICAKDSLPADFIAKFSNADITTMDSFWAAVAGTDLISHGLPREITVLDKSSSDEMTKRLAAKFLADPALSAPLAEYMMPSQVMENFFEIVAANVSVTGDYNPGRIYSDFYNAVRQEYLSRKSRVASALSALSQLQLTPKFAEQLSLIEEQLKNEAVSESSYFRNPPKCAKDIVEELKPVFGKDSGYCTLQNIVNAGIEPPELQICVEKFAEMIIKERKRLGALTFSDISDLALVTLRDNPEVRKYFAGRYRYIMVDEFQDNNTRQKDLLYLLADSKGAPGVPSVDSIDKNKLFFVGDEKQSIYRFRGADVSVFRTLQEEIKREGCFLPLSINYRSEPLLIDHFNRVFSKVLSVNDHPYDAGYIAINAGRKPSGFRPSIIFGVLDKAEAEKMEQFENKADILEAEAVGDYCFRMLESDEFLIPDKESGLLRRPSPHEIGILLRSTTNQLNIEKALKRRGIPYQVAANKSLMTDAVASDFYVLINSIIYPEDRKSLVALLRSPFCGLSEQSIISLFAEGEDSLAGEDRELYKRFSRFHAHIKEAAFRLSLPCLLEEIYIEGGYRDYLAANPGYTEHYDYLFSYASEMSAAGKGLTDFALFLRTWLGTNDAKMPETTVLHREKAGVQIMTVHKSKGLDFPIVIFSDTGRGKHNDTGRYVFPYNGNLVASGDRKVLKILESEENSKEEAETRRIMYVALTRARTHIVTTGSYKRSKDKVTSGSVFMWYCEAIGADLDSLTCSDPSVKMENLADIGPLKKRTRKDVSDLPFFAEGVFADRPRRISVSDICEETSGTGSGKALPECDADRLITSGSLYDGFGTLCHKVLEEMMRSGSYEGVVCNLCENDSDNSLLLNQAKVFADLFISSRIYREFIEGHSCREELRFYAPYKEGCALEGVIDLLVFGEEYNLVVDYKTDRFADPANHMTQLTTYMNTAEELYGKRCYGLLFYLRDPESSCFFDREGKPVCLKTNSQNPDSDAKSCF